MAHSLVVINPHASQVRDTDTRADLRRRLDAVLKGRDGTAPRIVETASQGDTRPLVRQALADGVTAVVGVGGDGTMRDIASELRDTGVPLGIIPAGTGNQVAAVMRIPLSLAGGVATLASRRTQTVDLGEVTVRPADGSESTSVFIIGCGAGFDARLMATTPPGLKQHLGKSAYAAQAMRLATQLEATPSRITVDGQVIEIDATIALIGNMGQLMPGAMDLRLPLDPTDGLFDVIAVSARNPVHGLRGLIDQLRRTDLGGSSGSDSIRLRGREVTIEAADPAPLEIDGDYVGEGSMSTRILPGALDVLVPSTNER